MKTAFVLVTVALLEIIMLVVAVPLLTPLHLRTTDFANFYVGASMVRQGKSTELYRRETQDAAFQSILGYRSNQYFVHPPFEAALFAPLTRLSIRRAFIVWMLINTALLGLMPVLLMSSLPWVARRPYLLLLAFCFLPVLIALNLGQDSILLLFLFSACYGQIRKEKQFTAGLLIALAAVKFQYPVMLFVLLVCSRKFRLIAGMVAGGVTLAVASALVAGRRGMVEYFAFVHDFNVHNGYGGLNPLVMVNARGFLAGLGFPEHADGYGLLIGIILLAGAGNLASRKRQEKLTQLEFAFFVTVALLASPYAHFPDMTILVLPAILTIDSAWKRKLHNPKLIAFCLAALFFVPYLLLSQGRHYWWESHVYLLFAIILMFGGCLAFEIIAVKKEQFAD